jgi:MFS family permease
VVWISSNLWQDRDAQEYLAHHRFAGLASRLGNGIQSSCPIFARARPQQEWDFTRVSSWPVGALLLMRVLPQADTLCQAGLLVQPLVGSYSDACKSSLGRRRPFIIGGGALCVCSLFLFGYAHDIAGLFAAKETALVRLSANLDAI